MGRVSHEGWKRYNREKERERERSTESWGRKREREREISGERERNKELLVYNTRTSVLIHPSECGGSQLSTFISLGWLIVHREEERTILRATSPISLLFN